MEYVYNLRISFYFQNQNQNFQILKFERKIRRFSVLIYCRRLRKKDWYSSAPRLIVKKGMKPRPRKKKKLIETISEHSFVFVSQIAVVSTESWVELNRCPKTFCVLQITTLQGFSTWRVTSVRNISWKMVWALNSFKKKKLWEQQKNCRPD